MATRARETWRRYNNSNYKKKKRREEEEERMPFTGLPALLYKVPVNKNISTLVPQPSPWRINDLYFRFIVLVNEIFFFHSSLKRWNVCVCVCCERAAVWAMQWVPVSQRPRDRAPRNRSKNNDLKYTCEKRKTVKTIIQNTWLVYAGAGRAKHSAIHYITRPKSLSIKLTWIWLYGRRGHLAAKMLKIESKTKHVAVY